MKNILTSFAIIATLSFSNLAIAQSNGSHDGHHASAQASEPKKDTKHGDMMGGDHMAHMHGMMDECMKNQKDAKVCHQQMMEQCQSHMGKDECQKMMKKMNAKKK